MFKITKEDYGTLKISIEDLFSKLSTIKEIYIENKRFIINFTQGGDLKWLSNMTGVVSANGNQACIWCYWNKKTELVYDAIWHVERCHIIGAQKIGLKPCENGGHTKIPLTKFISFENTIVDTLHLLLRIDDKLNNKLMPHIEFLNRERGDLFDIFKLFLENDCKISYTITFNKETNIHSFRPMNQNDRYKFMDHLTNKKNLLEVFPDL